VEAGATEQIFNDPADPRTADYVNGRFGMTLPVLIKYFYWANRAKFDYRSLIDNGERFPRLGLVAIFG